MTRLVLLDNTVLSNFAMIGSAALVLELFRDTAGTTLATMSEFQAGARSGRFHAHTWSSLPILELTAAEMVWSQTLARRLGAGERSCLAVAVHRDALLASDDADARAVAKRHGVAVTGTLGILLLGVERGDLILPHANQLLSQLIQAGYHSPVEKLDSLLNR